MTASLDKSKSTDLLLGKLIDEVRGKRLVAFRINGVEHEKHRRHRRKNDHWPSVCPDPTSEASGPLASSSHIRNVCVLHV